MVKRVLFLSAAGVFLIGLLMSCTMPGMSNVEFAKELMAESADATGLYEDPMASKSGGSSGDTIEITIDLPEGNSPKTGPYIATFVFDDYTPSFAPNSLVSGTLVVEIILDLDSENPSVALHFEGNLTVVGEHGGTYRYDADLTIDLSTGEYSYSDYIVIDGKVHKTG